MTILKILLNQVCLFDSSGVCEEYRGYARDVCELDESEWDYINEYYTIVSNFNLLCVSS